MLSMGRKFGISGGFSNEIDDLKNFNRHKIDLCSPLQIFPLAFMYKYKLIYDKNELITYKQWKID